jgi:hypothetical protein
MHSSDKRKQRLEQFVVQAHEALLDLQSQLIHAKASGATDAELRLILSEVHPYLENVDPNKYLAARSVADFTGLLFPETKSIN